MLYHLITPVIKWKLYDRKPRKRGYIVGRANIARRLTSTDRLSNGFPYTPRIGARNTLFWMILCHPAYYRWCNRHTECCSLLKKKRRPFRTSGHVMSRSHQSSWFLVTRRTITGELSPRYFGRQGEMS